ncbi:MAG: hypothetical protein HQL25_08140 [Candidatus Omnitrophica bacterium]|nr:hypothetical protein [Candidatus Omnitrophota bacterium]
MSIINEALKKTQKTMQTNRLENIINQTEKQIVPAPIEPQNTNSKNLINLLFAFCIILLTISLYNMFLGIKNVEPKIKYPTAPIAKANTVAVNQATQPAPVPTVNLVLNGIAYQNGKSAALINGDVYEAGAIIEGYTITKIDKNSIRMTKDGEEIILKVK